MGAWSDGLFDNDTALDAAYLVEERLGVLPNYDEEPDPEAEESTQAEAAARIDAAMPGLDWSDLDAYQSVILAGYLMRAGAKLPDDVRQRALDSVDEAAAEEDYFYPAAQEAVRAALGRYKDGSPWPFDQKGLFEVMAEKIESGESGLVNVPPRRPVGG